MPLFYENKIDHTTKLAIWKIEEEESFFLQTVFLQKQITHPHKRLQHLAGRYLLKYLFPDFPQEEIFIADTRKPYLPGEQYHFSISHCGNFAAAIVSSKKRVGIDIEIPVKKIETIANKFLSSPEKKIVAQNSFIEREWVLTLLWSAKEAVYKWWGNGKVQFNKNIVIEPLTLNSCEGKMEADFLMQEKKTLQLHYKIFDTLVLAWLVTQEYTF